MTIPNVRSQLGQFKIGPQLSYRLETDKGLIIEPNGGLQLIWNFAGDTAPKSAEAASEAAGPQGARGKVELGLRATMPAGVGLDLSGAYDGIGAGGYHAVTGRATVRVPLN